jgi:hypothetical protein
MKRPVTNHCRSTVVEIEDRRKAEINADFTKFASDHSTQPRGLLAGSQRILVPKLPQLPHGRHCGKSLPKPLHPAAFVVHTNEQCRASERTNFCAQRPDLIPISEIPREQDDPAHHRVHETFALDVGQRSACDVNNHRARGAV